MSDVKCCSPSIVVTVDGVATGFVGPHFSVQMAISLPNVGGADGGKEFGRFSRCVLKLRSPAGKALLSTALSTVISQLAESIGATSASATGGVGSSTLTGNPSSSALSEGANGKPSVPAVL